MTTENNNRLSEIQEKLTNINSQFSNTNRQELQDIISQTREANTAAT